MQNGYMNGAVYCDGIAIAVDRTARDFFREIAGENFGSHKIDLDLKVKIGTGRGRKQKKLKFDPAKWDEFRSSKSVAPLIRAKRLEGVKAEAGRRILAIAPEWKQRNLIARTVEIMEVGKTARDAKHKAELAAARKVWTDINAIREASNRIEAMDEIPVDFTANKYWE